MFLCTIRSACTPDGSIYLHRLDLAEAFERTRPSNDYIAAIKDWFVTFLRKQGDPEGDEDDFFTNLELSEIGCIIKAKYSKDNGGTYFCANDLIRVIEERRDQIMKEITEVHADQLGMPAPEVIQEMHDRLIRRIRNIIDDCKKVSQRKGYEILPSEN